MDERELVGVTVAEWLEENEGSELGPLVGAPRALLDGSKPYQSPYSKWVWIPSPVSDREAKV